MSLMKSIYLDFELEKSDYWSNDPLQINGKFNKDPFRNIFFNGRGNLSLFLFTFFKVYFISI